ncbi:MAG: hypothetical protein WCH61_09835 [bacterium]
MPNLTQIATRAENNASNALARWLAPANALMSVIFSPVSPRIPPTRPNP